VLTLAKEMPVHAIARLFQEHDHRIWRSIHFHIDRRAARKTSARSAAWAWMRPAGAAGTTTCRCSSTSIGRAWSCTEGRDAESFGRFAADFEAHGGRREQLTELCVDMAPSYRLGAARYLAQLPITFDRYHLIQNLNWAMDLVRRAEQGSRRR
jgi:hypothetical protein